MNKDEQVKEAVEQENNLQHVTGPNLEPWSIPGIRKYRDLRTGEIVRAVHYTGGGFFKGDFQSIVELFEGVSFCIVERNDLNPVVAEVGGENSITKVTIKVGDTVYLHSNNIVGVMSSLHFLYFFESVSESNGYISNTEEDANLQKENEELKDSLFKNMGIMRDIKRDEFALKENLNNSESLNEEFMKMLDENDMRSESLKLIIKELTTHI